MSGINPISELLTDRGRKPFPIGGIKLEVVDLMTQTFVPWSERDHDVSAPRRKFLSTCVVWREPLPILTDQFVAMDNALVKARTCA